MVASHICGSSARNLLHVIILVPKVLKWLIDFWSICVPLFYSPSFSYRSKWFCQEVENVKQHSQGQVTHKFLPSTPSICLETHLPWPSDGHKCKWRWLGVSFKHANEVRYKYLIQLHSMMKTYIMHLKGRIRLEIMCSTHDNSDMKW